MQKIIKKLKIVLTITCISVVASVSGDFYFRGQIDQNGSVYRSFGFNSTGVSSLYCDGICLLDKGWPLTTGNNWSEEYNYLNLLINTCIYFVTILLIYLIIKKSLTKISRSNRDNA